MGIKIEVERGQRLAELVCRLFLTTGIHGQTTMPEDLLPQGMKRGSLEHCLFITLTVAIATKETQINSGLLQEPVLKTPEPGAYMFPNS